MSIGLVSPSFNNFIPGRQNQVTLREVPRTIWSLWFEPVLELIETYDIQMWSYIDCDWDAQPMWHHVGFGDSRLVTSSDVMRKWHKYVLNNPRFIMAPLECKVIHEQVSISAMLSSPTTTTAVVLPSSPFVALLLFMMVTIGMGLNYARQRRDICSDPAMHGTELMVTQCKYGSINPNEFHP